jgi:transposase InsO family protein
MTDSDDTHKPPLPKSWPDLAKQALVLVHSMLKAAFDIELGRRLDCAFRHAREHAELERLRLDGDSDREVLRLLRARFGRMAPRKRTHFSRAERLRILELKALNGWTAAKTADVFLVDDETISRWMKELAEVGEEKLLAVGPPVNKFPEFVDRIVARMAVALPDPTKRKIATRLARAGLHISASAVHDRIGAVQEPDAGAAAAAEPAVPEESTSPRTVAAHHPNHVWNVDLTAVPLRGGSWTPLLPFTFPQVWPFYWWIAVAVDMFSRKVVGFAVFKRPPTSEQVQAFLGRAFDAADAKPKYFVTDKGKQFDCGAFRKCCRRRRIKPRYGAVGKYGSIVIERFNRTLKHEGLFLITIPFRLARMREEVRLIIEHYNPHSHCPMSVVA